MTARLGWLARRRVARHHCPDCDCKLSAEMDPVTDRCHRMPIQGIVFGHGQAPSKPPPPARRR